MGKFESASVRIYLYEIRTSEVLSQSISSIKEDFTAEALHSLGELLATLTPTNTTYVQADITSRRSFVPQIVSD